ncbi:MAG: hypothetical protein NZL87_10105, partial [Thermomicrobium sp.]|nr:hypothetical protein [Thermomicrobium sp.]
MHRVLVASLVLLAVACAVWAFRDPTVLALTLERLSPGLACALIALLATNELVKGARWAWYLRAARLPIRPLDGVTSYLAAQAASALPGGTILAARLAEEHGGGLVRLRHTTPALLVQGIGDLLAVSALASIGLALTDSSRVQFAVP